MKVWRPLEDKIDISVNEAWEIIQANLFVSKDETCSIEDSTGRILAQDIFADRDFPPFNRVAMDGICIRFKDFESGIRSFKIADVQAAGELQKTLSVGPFAIEVMTGASLPLGSDTVIRYEDLEINDGIATVLILNIREGQNVHNQGIDRKLGDQLIKKGKKITLAEIGVLATVGVKHIPVKSLPKVVVISTGDELVAIEENPQPHQIRKSNVYSLVSLLKVHGITADLVHLADNKKEISNRLESIFKKYDAALFSGAVSKGKFDFLPEVFENLEVTKHFHRVQQRPGKPFWFGSKNHTAIFAFPGNPVSTLVCAKRFFEPWLLQSQGYTPSKIQAVLNEDVYFKPSLQYFLPVLMTNDCGQNLASPIPGHGSGDLANLVDANAFLELPAEKSKFIKGEVYDVWTW